MGFVMGGGQLFSSCLFTENSPLICILLSKYRKAEVGAHSVMEELIRLFGEHLWAAVIQKPTVGHLCSRPNQSLSNRMQDFVWFCCFFSITVFDKHSLFMLVSPGP